MLLHFYDCQAKTASLTPEPCARVMKQSRHLWRADPFLGALIRKVLQPTVLQGSSKRSSRVWRRKRTGPPVLRAASSLGGFEALQAASARVRKRHPKSRKNKNKCQKTAYQRASRNVIRRYRGSHICHLSFIKLLRPVYKLFMPAAKCIHTILFTLLLHFYSALFPTFVYKNKSLL